MSKIRQEALFSEYKGNLYEFILALQIARHFGKEISFYEKINPQLKQMLEHQEAFMRDFYPNLLVSLPRIAESLKDKIIKDLNIKTLNNVEIIGKVAMASHAKELAETDILLVDENKNYNLSIKLGKSNSFLNTKSAGIKSFVRKYFEKLQCSLDLQTELDKVFDQSFDEFVYNIHEIAQLEYDDSFKTWIDNGFSVLPGELKDEYRQVYLKFTHKVTNTLYSCLKKLKEENSVLFLKSLYPLLGYSNDDIIQVSTYYKNENNNYSLDHHRIEHINDDIYYKAMSKKENVNYINIDLNTCILQIRLKAMNKFSNRGFKVNCSVKYLN